MMTMIRRLVTVLTFMLVFVACTNPEKVEMTQEFVQFLMAYEAKVIPLNKEYALTYFTATISGKEEDYQKTADLEIQLGKIHANKDDFAKLKRFKESNYLTEPALKRQLEVIYNKYLGNQIDEIKLEEIIKLSKEIEKKFSTFRAEVDGKKMTDNEIEEVLKQSTDSQQLQKVWTASKEVGRAVSEDVLRLVRMRNEAAKELGFPNFHAMQLSLGEQDPAAIENLFDELDTLTRDSFAGAKAEVDSFLSGRYGVPKDELMPWHYQNRYFQEAPKVYDVDLDKYYKDEDVVALTESYFAGLGLPIEDMVAKSDLFEKAGKYQHAYCTDIDREGDVRVVCNVKPNYNWMSTMLHEYGHAVYFKFHDRATPWVLREPAHTLTTEAIAMLFGRFASNPAWLHDVAGISEAEKEQIATDSFKTLRLEQLTFSRWVQVMYRFEKAMYENPDQDLNALWWDLVEKYQMLKRPPDRNAPDWASKIHVALYPAYYHNYLMGELLASQLSYYINQNVLKTDDVKKQSFANQKAVGQYLIDKVFVPANKYYWDDMIEKATGEKLTAKYFARQFVGA